MKLLRYVCGEHSRAEYQENSILLYTQPNIHISDHYVMAIRWFFLGPLAALSVPVTLLEPSWLGPIKALAAVDIRDKDNRPHNVLPSFSPSLLARRGGTFEGDL